MNKSKKGIFYTACESGHYGDSGSTVQSADAAKVKKVDVEMPQVAEAIKRGRR